MISTGWKNAETQSCLQGDIFFIIIDEFLVRRGVYLQFVLALLLAPSHTLLLVIFYVGVTPCLSPSSVS